MNNVAILKREIRRATVQRILAISHRSRVLEDLELARRFPDLDGWRESRGILLFSRAFPEEIATESLLLATLSAGKRLICPRVDRRAKCLKLFEIKDPAADFEAGTMGIPEPRRSCPEVGPMEVDWVLVPGIAFDASRSRLGRGAGNYDRLLPTLRPGVPRWALIYDAQWVEKVPVEPHDVALDGVVSPTRIIRR